MGRTHAVGGVASLWLLRLVPGAIGTGMAIGNGNVGILAAVAAFGALLPDMDASVSLLSAFRIGGRRNRSPGSEDVDPGFAPFALPAMFLHRAFGHRGALHSLVALGIVASVGIALAAFGFVGWQASAALALGYSSHLILDACTPRGIPILWPQRERRHVLPRQLRVVTGSPAEDLVLALLAPAAVALVLPMLR